MLFYNYRTKKSLNLFAQNNYNSIFKIMLTIFLFFFSVPEHNFFFSHKFFVFWKKISPVRFWTIIFVHFLKVKKTFTKNYSNISNFYLSTIISFATFFMILSSLITSFSPFPPIASKTNLL